MPCTLHRRPSLDNGPSLTQLHRTLRRRRLPAAGFESSLASLLGTSFAYNERSLLFSGLFRGQPMRLPVHLLGAPATSLSALVALSWLTVAFAGEPPSAAATTPGVTAKSSEPNESLRWLLAITDDDFLMTGDSIWCEAGLQRAVDECRRVRAATELRVEPIRAGAPARLRGGNRPSGARRALFLLCDNERRILGCCVGVPTAGELLTLSEDADDLAITAALTAQESAPADEDADVEPEQALGDLVRERAARRVTRHYRPLLDSVQPFFTVDRNAELISGALASDIGERFLIEGPADAQRWLSIQQHAEARRYWSEVMNVGLVGKSADEIWPEFAACVWGAEPWRRSETIQQIETWCDETLQTGWGVLQLDLEKKYIDADSLVGTPRAAGKRGAAAVAAEEPASAAALASAAPRAQTVDLCGLAVVLQARDSRPVSLRGQRGVPIRWVVFRDPESEPELLSAAAEERLISTLRRLQRP